MKSHIKILSRLLSVMPDADCNMSFDIAPKQSSQTDFVGKAVKTTVTYKNIKVTVEQVGDNVHCELSSESLELSIKTSDVNLCADELVRHVSRIFDSPDYSAGLTMTV